MANTSPSALEQRKNILSERSSAKEQPSGAGETDEEMRDEYNFSAAFRLHEKTTEASPGSNS